MMEVYLYQLENHSELQLSLSMQVDIHFWKQRGIPVRSVYVTSSINRANQLRQSPRKISRFLDPVTLSFSTINWRKIQMISDCLFSLFHGRVLLSSELQARFNQKGDDLWEAIQLLYLQKKVQIIPGVEWGRFARFAKCHRCSADFSQISWHNCATCGGKCATCNHCILLGRSRSCSPLFFFSSKRANRPESVAIQTPHTLTPWQQQTVRQMNQFLHSNQKELLFWAVTGAGKTECMVPIIQSVLEQGKRVLWVTPRKDVVLELAPRLKQIFPSVQPAALYGGSSDFLRESRLIIATAHQVYRYMDYFDLGIVDEADAFPLYHNRWLQSGIRRALTKTAKQIFLTATPPITWKHFGKEGKGSVVILPARYHGYPLPVPILKIERRLWKTIMKSLPNPTLTSFIRRVLVTEGQAILFVPRLKDVFQLYQWLKQIPWMNEKEFAGVYAQDPERDHKIRQFRLGKVRFLISTTILERGVTVQRCHVAIVGADHPIFDRATLIQMAGRVGRSASYQRGEVWLIAQEKTKAQLQAIKEIKKLNQIAKKEGISSKELYSLC